MVTFGQATQTDTVSKKQLWTTVFVSVLGTSVLSAMAGGIYNAIEERRHPERVQKRLEKELRQLKIRVQHRRDRAQRLRRSE